MILTYDSKWQLRLGDAGEAQLEVYLGDETVSVEQQASPHGARSSRHHDLRTGRATFVDHAAKTVATWDTAIDAGRKDVVVRHLTQSRRDAVTGNDATLVEIEDEGRSVNAWVLPKGTVSVVATSALWAMLFPGARSLAQLGLPVELNVSDPREPGRPSGTIRLTRARNVPVARRPAAPSSYRDVTKDYPVKGARITKTEGAPARSPASIGQPLHAAGHQPVGFAWVTGQPFLDRLRDSINAISRKLGEFSGPSNPTRVRFDWWDQFSPHLTLLGTGALRAAALRTLALQLLRARVIQGAPLAGSSLVDEATRTAYTEVLANAAGEARWTALQNRVDDDLLVTLAESELRAVGSPEVDFGLREMAFDVLPFFLARLYDFQATIAVKHQAVIEELQFREGRVRVAAALPKVSLEFQFVTIPGPASWFLGILTFGLVPAALATWGKGLVELTNVRMEIDLRPTADGTGLAATLDRGATRWDLLIALFPVNPLQLPIDLLLSFILTRSDVIRGPLLAALETAIARVPNFFPWTSSWRARGGPGTRASALRIEPDGVVAIGAASPALNDGPPLPAGPLARTQVAHHAYVLSDSYLTAWIRNLTRDVSTKLTAVPTDELERRTVALPAADSIEPPERVEILPEHGRVAAMVEGTRDPCEVPASDPPTHRIRIERRSLPMVVFPSDGRVTRCGQMELRYDVSVETIRRVPSNVVVPEACEWTYRDDILATHVKAHVRVATDLLLAFAGESLVVLPEIVLTPVDGNGRPGAGGSVGSVEQIELAPLLQPARSAVESYFIEICRADAERFVVAAVHGGSLGRMCRLIPSALPLSQEWKDLVTLGASASDFEYVINDRLLYWNLIDRIALRDHIG